MQILKPLELRAEGCCFLFPCKFSLAYLLTKRGTLPLSALILLTVCANGEIIPAVRRTTWQDNVGVQGGVPARNSPSDIFQTFSPGATAAQINTAIANCPSGKVVELTAGTFNLTGTINLNKSNVTLRGSGGPYSTTQTILKFVGAGGRYIFMNGSGDDPISHVTDWTSGYSKGTTSITVAKTASLGIVVGSIVGLDQLNDSNYISIDSGYHTITGQNRDRLQFQLTEVTAITDNTITIKPGVLMPNYSSVFTPQIWRVTRSKLVNTGIEDLKVDGTGSAANYNIQMEYAQNCWVKNVESLQGHKSHVFLFRTKNIEIRHNWFHDSTGTGNNNYGMTNWSTSQTLIEDNIWSHMGSSIVVNASTGCVIAYNYIVDSTWSSSHWLPQSIAANHETHNAYHLYEGNVGNNWYSDFIFGSASNSTVFRNRFIGVESGRTRNTHAIVLEMYNRKMNVVGNVLGRTGYHDHYERCGPLEDTPLADWWSRAVYKLGYKSTYDATSDDLVRSTLIRHGNYDTYTDSIDGGGNGIVWERTNANVTDYTDHNIPDSLYLAARPSWFGNLTWPPINPTSPGSATATSIPAGYRFVNGGDPPSGTPSLIPTGTSSPNPIGMPSPTHDWKSVDKPKADTAGAIVRINRKRNHESIREQCQ